MNWYLSKIIFRIICGDGNHAAQFDEQLRLISANNVQEAYQKSQLLGSGEQDVFYNKEKQLVQWKFIGVSDLYQLNELIDGAELYSRIEEKDNADSYIQVIHKKSVSFQYSHSQNILSFT